MLPLKIDPDNEYEREMLSRRVKYVRIIKKPGKNRLRWYAQLTLEGKPALKYSAETGKPIHSVGKGDVGIDIGPQTVAYASDKEVLCLNLLTESPISSIKKRSFSASWIAAAAQRIRTTTNRTAQ